MIARNNIHGAQLISKVCSLLNLFSRQKTGMSLTDQSTWAMNTALNKPDHRSE